MPLKIKFVFELLLSKPLNALRVLNVLPSCSEVIYYKIKLGLKFTIFSLVDLSSAAGMARFTK